MAYYKLTSYSTAKMTMSSAINMSSKVTNYNKNNNSHLITSSPYSTTASTVMPISHQPSISDDVMAQCRQILLGIAQVDALERTLMGTFAPMLSFITLLINSCAIAVLMHKSFRRSPSHVVLVSIFAVDMATAAVPLPFCIYFYTMGYYKAYLPFLPCYLRQIIMRLGPTISNTASIWLFTFLALQRYFIVCKRINNGVSRLRAWAVSIAQQKTNSCIAAILIMAITIHSIQLVDRYPAFISCPIDLAIFEGVDGSGISGSGSEVGGAGGYDYDYEDEGGSYDQPVTIYPAPAPTSTADQPIIGTNNQSTSTSMPSPLVDTCWLGSRFNEALRPNVANGIYATYYVIRAIFIHLLPCCLVTFSTCSLVMEIRAANRRRRALRSPMAQALRSAAAAVVSIQLESQTALARTLSLTTNNTQAHNQAPLLLSTVAEDESSCVNHEPGTDKVHVEAGGGLELLKSPTNNINFENESEKIKVKNDERSALDKMKRQLKRPFTCFRARRSEARDNKGDNLLVEAAPIHGRSISAPVGGRNNGNVPSLLGRIMTTSFAKAMRPDKEYSITSMLIAIMTVFLSVQLPQAFVFVWGILSGLGIVSTSENAAYGFDLTLKILNILYLLTFPIQSGLCFVMNRPFRQSFLCMIGMMSNAALVGDAPAGGEDHAGGEKQVGTAIAGHDNNNNNGKRRQVGTIL